jgi:hypothetical protein
LISVPWTMWFMAVLSSYCAVLLKKSFRFNIV